MRAHKIMPLVVAVVAVAACDTATSPRVAVLGQGLGFNTTRGFAITPNRVVLIPTQSVQLATNATAPQVRNVEWRSLDPRIAFVTATGLVVGGDPGSTIIVARLLTDTTLEATASVQVERR
jgi:hypothetical protein